MLIHKEMTAVVEGMSIPAQLSWSDTNPLAVTVNLRCPEQKIWQPWVMALELVSAGINDQSPCGYGDVACWSETDDLSVEGSFVLSLNSPEGTATVSLSFELVQHFVNRIVSEFSAEDEARAVALQVDTFLRDLSLEAF